MKKIIFIFIMALAANTLMAGMVISGTKVNASGGIYINIMANSKSLVVTNNGKLTLDGFLTVNSEIENNATVVLQTGSSLLNEGNITGSGLFQVEQTVEDNLIHYFSSPVGLENTMVFNLGFVNKFDEPQNKWVALENIEALQVGSGYAVQFLNPPTVVFEGMVNTGNQDINCTNIGGGWNLIGNPYPSAIDFEAPGWTKSIIDNTLYFWNGVNYSYYVVPGGENPPDGNLYVNNGTNIIPSRQGFFVKCNSNGTVGMTNEVRVHDNATAFYKNGVKSDNLQYVKLLATGNGFTDEMMVGFNTSATRFFDGNFDAFKLWSTYDGVPQLASVISETGEQLAINLYPELEKNMLVPLIFKSSLAGNYTISISDLNLNNSLWIEDTDNGESLPVAAGSPYLFHYSTPNNEKSFNLHFKEGQLGITEAGINDYLVVSSNGEIAITLPVDLNNQELNISVYDVMGRKMYGNDLKISGNSVKIPATGFAAGVYIVKIINGENQLFTQKVTLH